MIDYTGAASTEAELARQRAQANALRDVTGTSSTPTERTQVAMGLLPKVLLGIGAAGAAGSAYNAFKKKPQSDGSGRTTGDAFQQRQDAMDAANEELRRQKRAPGLERMERQLEEEGK